LKKGETASFSFFLITDRKNIDSYKTDIKVDVISEGNKLEKLKTTFISPPTK